jgi:hypothetical protein
MSWYRRIRRWLSKAEPPALIRLRLRTGEFVEGRVDIDAKLRDGRVRSSTVHAAQGLCRVHFYAADRVELELRHAPLGGELRSTIVELTRADVALGHAPVVWLD